MAVIPSDVRAQLIERRDRIEAVIAQGGPATQLENLLQEIDVALDRFAAGTFGVCETCGDAIEPDRLQADPLVRFCLDHLSPVQARALEQDLELASRVQRNLLPPAECTESGWQIAYRYEPLGSVSGDYVDLQRPTGAGGDLILLFGDIAGKGVAASMLMAHLHATMRTLVDLGLPLVQLVERANRVFCESTIANHYATLVGGRLSPGGQLEICNAGHCPPIHLHDGRAVEITPTAVPVGLFCVKEFGAVRLDLAPGDSLLLYTDGITEASGPHGEEYGSERLIRVALTHASDAPSSLLAACLGDLEAFRGGARRTDDRTLMAIKRLRAPAD